MGRPLNLAHAITIWREHRGLTVSALAEKAGVSGSHLAEIETKNQPGPIQAFRGRSLALSVAVAPRAAARDRR